MKESVTRLFSNSFFLQLLSNDICFPKLFPKILTPIWTEIFHSEKIPLGLLVKSEAAEGEASRDGDRGISQCSARWEHAWETPMHCRLCSFVCFKILPSLTLNNLLNFESRKKTFYTLIRYNQTNVSMKTEFQKKSSLMSYCIEKLSWSQQIAARRFLYEWEENFHTISNI